MTSTTPSPDARRWTPMTRIVLLLTTLACLVSRAEAHGIPEASRETIAQGGIVDYIWLGAEHMVTGYDHLLFLFGVVFFLTGFRDIVRFITAFTIGHCITLLGATMAGISANAYLIDAVIALSVIYKGFENLDGFKKTLGFTAPNLLGMVFVFGLIHGFGLSTRLQEITVGHDGLVSRILAFNVGVELGQIAALTVMLGFFSVWRSSASFERFSKGANAALILAGVGLFALQIDGYLHEDHHDHHAEETVAPDDHGHAHKATTPAPEAPVKEVPAQKDDPKQDATHGATNGHGHGHGHAHAHAHAHDVEDAKPTENAQAPSHSHGTGHHEDHAHETKEAEPVPAAQGHSHGSGGTHSH